VHVTETLFEVQHLFAHRLETEVSGFDDAGVHGTDGNFVDAGAMREEELIVVIGRGLRGRIAGRGKVLAQRIGRVLPRLVARPAARIRVIHECHAEHILGVALGTVGAGKIRRVRKQNRRGTVHDGARQQIGTAFFKTRADVNLIVAGIFAPARDPAATGARGLFAKYAPIVRGQRDELRGSETRGGALFHARVQA